jgi:signal transduction histidine kinase
MPQPSAFAEARRSEVDRLLARFMDLRARLAPVAACAVVLFAIYDSAWWRRVGLIGLAATHTIFLIAAFRLRREASRFVAWSLAAGMLLIVGSVALMGGIDSPTIPILFLFVAIVSLAVPRRTAVAFVVTMLSALLIVAVAQATGAFAHAMPEVFGGGPYSGTRTLMLCRFVAVFLMLPVGFWGVVRVRETIDGLGERLVKERDEALADHVEQRRTLTTVTGEIAHELKNPLAAIKGLAGMVARGLDGKPAEHMAVLRREVDRMQSILEEFLNFSRPLVPLSITDVDLEELCNDVLGLVESSADAKAVRFNLALFPQAHVRADRRKLKQILINLLQNALDASPRGGTIEIAADPIERGGLSAVRLTVSDEGPGLAPEVASRVFEPGVTTKEHGSGLGLPLSRAMARQHGGELTLTPAGERGCVAEMVLPEEARP